MQRFAQLIDELNNTTKTNDKRDALVRYLQDVPDADRVWLVAIFTHRRPRRLINTTLLKQWCMEVTGLPQWLFDEGYHYTGDLSEAIALMLPDDPSDDEPIPLHEMMLQIRKMLTATEGEKKAFVLDKWHKLSREACFLFNKLIIGGFRIGVSQTW